MDAKHRIYRFTPTQYPEDYSTVQSVLASVDIRMISRYSDGHCTIVVPPSMITASAFIMQGFLDNMFVDAVEYRSDDPTDQYRPFIRNIRQ